jgi:hypothetical protein
MKLLTYQYQDKAPAEWKLSPIKLHNINLIGGLSAVGKTRLLNTIFNLSLIIQKKRRMTPGCWKIDFQINRNKYNYVLHLEQDPTTKKIIVGKESLTNQNKELINRTKKTFIFQNKKLPALSKEDIGIYLLRENIRVQNIYNEFKKIYIRRLNPFAFGQLKEQPLLGGVPQEVLEKPAEDFTLEYIQNNFKDVNTQLLLLKMHHPTIYDNIFSDFKRIFPFVQEMDIKPANQIKQLTFDRRIPLDIVISVLVIREKGVKSEIPIMNFSSGMLRCIIQLVDIYTMPDNSIYLIDELENSMGVKALPEMTEILLDRADKIQLIFTSHLPYIFNNVHIQYWTILTRKGNRIKVTSGETLGNRFAKSHQDAYTQLINSELIETGI